MLQTLPKIALRHIFRCFSVTSVFFLHFFSLPFLPPALRSCAVSLPLLAIATTMSLRSLAVAMPDAALPPAHKLRPTVSLPMLSSSTRVAPRHLRANWFLPLAPLVAPFARPADDRAPARLGGLQLLRPAAPALHQRAGRAHSLCR